MTASSTFSAMHTTTVTIVILLRFVAPGLCSPHHISSSEREGLEFLDRHMPEKDRQLLNHGFLVRNVQFAVKARELTPWGPSVPWSVFLNDVLPYAVLNEQRDDWREFFFDALSPFVVETTSIEQAASVINARIWKLWNLTFVGGQTPQTMSPFQRWSSWTPEWNDGSGGNHDWVEIWMDEDWHFIDAFDGTKFDEGWFVPSPVKYQLPNSGNHSIYASSFQSTTGDVHFPLAWDFEDSSVPGLDVTQWYLDSIRRQALYDHEKLNSREELAANLVLSL